MKTLTTKLFATVGLGTALLLGGCEMPRPESTQWGYRGPGMEGLYNTDRLVDLAENNDTFFTSQFSRLLLVRIKPTSSFFRL